MSRPEQTCYHPSYVVSIIPISTTGARHRKHECGAPRKNVSLESLGNEPVCPLPWCTVYVTFHRYRTLMAYSANGCESVPRINRFSNPMISFAGRPQGSATSDNARRLRETMVRNNSREDFAILYVFRVAAFGSNASAITQCNPQGMRKDCSRDFQIPRLSFTPFLSLGDSVHYKGACEYISCEQRVMNAVHKTSNSLQSASGADDVERVAVAKQRDARHPRSSLRCLGCAGQNCAQA